jgi:hypothetical protein
MRALPTTVLVLLLALTPALASAVTVDQIVALSKAGVSEAIILALIDRDKTVFTIDPERLVALQRDGLTENIIVAMLKSGRDEGNASADAASAFNAAAIMSTLAPAPEVVIIGHGPDRPNTYSNDFFNGAVYQDIVPVPAFYGAYGVQNFGDRGFRRSRRSLPPPTVLPSAPPPALSLSGVCISHGTTTAPPQVGNRGFLVDCPPRAQPRRRR